METFLEYILKSTIYLSLMIFVYRLSFKNETYFKLNRLFLLGSVFTSCFLLPLLFKLLSQTSDINNEIFLLPEISINPVISKNSSSGTFNLISSIGDIYFFVTGILILRLIAQIMQILRMYIKSNLYSANSTIIYTDDHPPFSFFNLIFINANSKNDDVDKIILHESVHVNQYHTVDILLIEIICIFHWFNPFVWLYKASFRELHEYLADEVVINKGYDKKAYQSLMLSVATGINDWKPTNKFNSLIKKRIIMMSKQKSTNSSLIKYVLVFPLVAILWFLPSFKIEKAFASNRITKIEKFPILVSAPQSKDEIYKVVEVAPEFIGGQKAMTDFLIKNVKYPEDDQKKGIEGTVYVSFVVEKDGSVSEVKAIRGVNTSLDNEAIRVVKLMSKMWKPGTQKGKPVRVQFNLPIKFKLDEKKK